MQISAGCLLAREEFRDMWFRAARTACSASCSSGTKSCDCVKQVVQSRNPGGPVGARRLVPWEFTVLHCSGGLGAVTLFVAERQDAAAHLAKQLR